MIGRPHGYEGALYLEDKLAMMSYGKGVEVGTRLNQPDNGTKPNERHC